MGKKAYASSADEHASDELKWIGINPLGAIQFTGQHVFSSAIGAAAASIARASAKDYCDQMHSSRHEMNNGDNLSLFSANKSCLL